MVNCMGLRTRKVADGGVVTVNAFVVVVAAVALTVAVVIGAGASWQSGTGGDVSSSARSIMSGGASFTAGFAGGGCSFLDIAGGCHRCSRNES